MEIIKNIKIIIFLIIMLVLWIPAATFFYLEKLDIPGKYGKMIDYFEEHVK